MDKVIIFVADDKYIDHVKAIAVNCRLQGKYEGDFAVICPVKSSAGKEFRKYGFTTLEHNDQEAYFQKFFVFGEQFKYYDKVIYLDCDVVVQDDLQLLFDLLDTGDLFMDVEDLSTIETFWRAKDVPGYKETCDKIIDKYPHAKNQTFNTAFIVFKPSSIPENSAEKLIEIQKEIESINNYEIGGTDQQTVNLLFWNNTKPIPNKLVCFWGCAEPINNIYSESRGWIGNERIVAVHQSRWYGQWIDKTPDMDAYLNHKLGIPNHELYKQNLAKFDQLFKAIA